MTKRYTRNDGFSTRELLYYAWGHLASAKVLFERSFDCYDSAGHLSHLGIELILKAFLLHYGRSFPNEHDLLKLLAEIKKSCPTLEIKVDHEKTLERINPFVSIRYPTPAKPIEIGNEDGNAIESLFVALQSAMPSELRQELQNRHHTLKDGRILMSKPKD